MEVMREEGEAEGKVDGSGSTGGGGDGDSGGGGKTEAVRVLVVDDSAVDRKVVEMLLKRSGGTKVEVVNVDSAKKAMDVLGFNEVVAESSNFNDKKIDIILTDYCMPEMNGYDLLKAVKEHSSLRSIPVFIMSSENNPQRISRCRASGAEDFILKPLKKKDVERLISWSEPVVAVPKSGTKRKLSVDLIAESSSSETQTRQRLTKVAVA